MKKKEKQNYWQKSGNELNNLLSKKRLDLAKTSLKIKENKDKNMGKKIKKEIAFLKTIIEEKRFQDNLKNVKETGKQ